jgi:hypothetical protein
LKTPINFRDASAIDLVKVKASGSPNKSDIFPAFSRKLPRQLFGLDFSNT